MKEHAHDDDDLGLVEDLQRLAAITGRRRALQLLGGVGLLPLLAACTATEGGVQTGIETSPDGGTTTPESCSNVPEETAGPYPGDGSNGANALTMSGIVRSDIRSSFDTMSGTASGIPLTIKLQLVNTKDACAPLEGYAIYLWHCDRDGKYSLYTIATENYLRGVQQTDANGVVTFTSIFPAAYSGRWPHIHFEVYPSLAKANAAGNKLKTSQLALPEAACDAVYATAGYSASISNMKQTSLSNDNVFRDGSSLQMAAVTGNVTDGYMATLVVGVAV